MLRSPDTVQRIYLDHNATTPPHPAVIERMTAALREDFGNPSSLPRLRSMKRAPLSPR
jgi:cysteine desulfurase